MRLIQGSRRSDNAKERKENKKLSKNIIDDKWKNDLENSSLILRRGS